ncbi:DUF6292 family protein [Actinosynnema sp. NPDC020468]|uniref:DUF6292 family protein n=1 Tax=Actinosynnema sp. NPDC020468 TaxID=3154488 RepID=UPI0033F1C24D
MDDLAVLHSGLAGYVRAVAEAVGVPPEGTGHEVSDTATAYLALAEGTGDPLMLLWSEWRGWSIAVETGPAEPAVVVAHLGAPLVPEPAAVARFVRAVLAGGRGDPEPDFRADDRGALARSLVGYAG